jgi:hypothetical protein
MTVNNENENHVAEPVRLKGWWKLDEATGTVAADASGAGHPLHVIGDPKRIKGGKFGGAFVLDGMDQWLKGDEPVLESDRSFSVAAWVRLDSATMGLWKPGWFAMTALSHDGASHSPFYLGARLINESPAGLPPIYRLRWDFTVAPVDGSETGPVELVHAYASGVIEEADLDAWTFIVGVYDLGASEARVYVPSHGDEGTAALPRQWPAWRADGGLAVGQARFRDGVADQWHGAVGQIRVYAGVLTAQDTASLYTSDALGG